MSKGSISFRLFGWQLEKYAKTIASALNNPDALYDWKYWKPEPMQILVDNGMGQEGNCPAHGYQHIQEFPIGKRPMLCHEAVMMKERR